MAERQKRDLFGECNVDGHPIDQFISECCANCFNPECTRSLSGKSKFDARTATWYERYFADKGMDPKDERFTKIAAQRFIVIDPGRLTPEVGSAWVDPQDIESAAPAAPPPTAQPAQRQVPIHELNTAISVPKKQEAPPPEPPPPAPAAPAAPPPAAAQRNLPHHLLLANVPPQSGLMIPRPPGASSAPTAPKDPWAAPAPDPKNDAPIVQPGARVKMGGGV